MNIKQEIGQRITSSRKQIGITIKELAARTHSLSAARISNWEQGTRSPGPREAKMLAKVLGISASYLLCLSDDTRGDIAIQTDILPRVIPLLSLKDAKQTKINRQKLMKDLSVFSEDIPKIALDEKTKSIAGPHTFAVVIEDSSMSPDFQPNDIIVVNPDRNPKPGQTVIAHINSSNSNLVRKYRESQSSYKNSYELVALNSDWGTIHIKNEKEGLMLATVIEHRRYLP